MRNLHIFDYKKKYAAVSGKRKCNETCIDAPIEMIL